MEYLPTSGQIDRTRQNFNQNPPLYRLLEECGDTYYNVYMVEDAAADALMDVGIDAKDPFYMQKIQLLAGAAEKQIPYYPARLKMRFVLQGMLNARPVDRQR